jgi:serine protease Do
MDSLVTIPRSSVIPLIYLHCRIPSTHASAAILGDERMGSGILVNPDRVLTASFLVVGAETIEAVTMDGQRRFVEGLMLDHDVGLALLTVTGLDLPIARLGRGTEAVPGLPVFLLSCTGETERKGATGHVAEVAPFETYWEYMLERAIMTDAVNPGLTGAALHGLDGKVLGLVTLHFSAVGRYSVAIPMDVYWNRRRELEGTIPPRPVRAWLGFFSQEQDGTVIVTGIVKNSPADKVGLHRGDVVLSVEGRMVGTLRVMYEEIWRHQPGDSIRLQILRDARILTIDVQAQDRYLFFK